MQSDRPISVSSPLGEDVLLFYRMNATESLGQLFDFDLDVLSKDHNIKLEDLLGQSMTVHLELPDGGERHFNGLVSQLSFLGTVGRYARYGIQLHPWLWFLTRTADCRIFQNKKVPEIIKEVFGDFGFSDVEESLSGNYEPWDYCVQYRETAFNFICRLMEREGIYFYFKHEKDKHTLVLSDSYSAHAAVADYEKIPFYPPEDSKESERDRFTEWSISQQVQSTSYTLNDYNFETPKSDIKTTITASKKHGGTDYKVFDYPGEYRDAGVGNEYVKYRMQELSSDYEIHSASGSVRGLMAGCLFSLFDHPRDDQNKEYLVVSASHSLESTGYESGDKGAFELGYVGSITAIDAQVPYRSPRTTRKPSVQGPQTAVVVGASGEDVWTDKYGRVKVQFHWDRVGKSDENSSCWVRVSQNSAGKNWGGMFVPHVGHEVIVDFLEGDPDQPIITGRVYNADNMPPKTLPDHDHLSIIRDHYGNEIVFDGTPGDEHITLMTPHHQSGLMLGRSLVEATWSNKSSYTMGTRYSHTYGNKLSWTYGTWFSYTKGVGVDFKLASTASFQVGTAVSGFGGAKLGITVGTDVSLNLATKVTGGWARTLNYNRAEYARVSSGIIKHDSEKSVYLCGGDDDATIVDVGKKAITLTYGVGSKRSKGKDLGVWGAAASGVGSMMASVGQFFNQDTQSMAAMDSFLKQQHNATSENAWEGEIDTDAVGGSAGAWVAEGVGYAGVVGGAIVGVAGADTAPPVHSSEKAKITIKDGHIEFFAGQDKETRVIFSKTAGLTIKAKKQIKMDNEEDIRINSKKDIHLESDGVILHKSAKDVEIKAKSLNVKKGEISHKNLKVLE